MQNQSQITYYPLTHPQMAIWMTEMVYPDTAVSNIAGSAKIKENVDIEILKKAINIFIEKNEGIRLRFKEIDGQPMQYVVEYEHHDIDFIDFTSRTIEHLYEWDEMETSKPFNLIDSPLYYFAVFKVNENFGGFYTKAQHMVVDAWSMVLITNQVIGNYYKLLNHTEIESENEPSYTEYIQKEQNYMTSEKFEQDKLFWDNKFSDFEEVTTLKTRRSKQSTLIAKRNTFIIPQKLSNLIRDYSEKNKVSIFSMFLAALSIYIKRVTQKDEVVISTPVLNRSSAREKSILGMFISSIPLKLSLDDGLNFKTAVEAVSREFRECLRHQKFPFEMIQKEMREKHHITDRLTDIFISFQNAKNNKSNQVDFETRWHFNGNQVDSLGIHISDREDTGCILFNYDYLNELYYSKEIRFIHDHVMRLLWHGLDNPDKEISKLEMVSEAEKKKLLYEFNDTYAEYPRDMCINQLFEAQVERTPENIALMYEDDAMTYRELNEKANQLAWNLSGKGVYPEVIVGIMVERSFEMIVGLMGILKAGGAYLPIDPEYPEDRIKYMLEDSKTTILLTQSHLFSKIEFSGQIIDLNKKESYSENSENLNIIVNSKNLAYVIYTSGSTGRPKGVMIENTSVINRLNWMQKDYLLSSSDCILQKTSISFDVSIWELFWWSFWGAKLCLLDQGGEKEPEKILKAIQDKVVTVLHFVPSMLSIFLDCINENELNKLISLKQVYSSGEALTLDHTEKFKKKLFDTLKIKLTNLYGPTEATVDVSVFRCFENIESKSVPIGKPIDNTKLYILDKNQNLLPIGIPGELHISGCQVARGYLNNEEMSNNKFILNPWEETGKMYKTGDLARWFSNGDIDYIGRIDHQVKIKGFRIEIGEIESVLLKHRLIKYATVITKIDKNSNKYLCAYIVSDNKLKTSEIKAHLLKMVPQYMVPSHFVKIDEIPLLSNGKVNKTYLQKLENHLDTDVEYIEARNKDEKFLSDLFMEVLDIDKISIKDNFFEIGGDSLKALTLISKINKNITFSDFIVEPTIELLARKMNKESNANSILINLNECEDVSNKTNIICVPYGGGNPISYYKLANAIVSKNNKIQVKAVNLPGHNLNDLDKLDSIDSVANKILESLKGNDEEYIIYGHCVGSALAFEVARLMERYGFKLKGVFIGGMILPKLINIVGKHVDPWKFKTDDEVINYLKKIDDTKSNLFDANKILKIDLRSFRHDVRCFMKYWGCNFNNFKKNKLKTKLYCVIGDSDLATIGYESKYKSWGKIVKNVDLIVLKSANHYFLESHYHELSDIILNADNSVNLINTKHIFGGEL